MVSLGVGMTPFRSLSQQSARPAQTRRTAVAAVFIAVALGVLFVPAGISGAQADASHGGQLHASALWGKTVAHLSLKTDSSLTLIPFNSQIVQKLNEPLDPRSVAQSLKNLYATGRFLTLEAEAITTAGGVDLIFSGKTQYFIGLVEVKETGKAIPETALAGSAQLRMGAPLREGDAARAEANLRAVLAAHSYNQSQLHFFITKNPEDQLANVVLVVNPGKAARLASVTFDQTGVFTAQRLQSTAGWKTGTVLNPSNLQHGFYEIRRLFQRRGYLEVTTRIQARVYSRPGSAERLSVHINPGPLVRVRLEGAPISQAQLQKTLTPIFQEGLTDDLSLDAGARDLEDYFAGRGYFNATATWHRIRRPHETDITYVIDQGKQAVFTGFDFRGNHSFPTAALAPLVTIRPPGMIGHTHGVFSREMLRADVKALTNFYLARGYLQASIKPKLHPGPGTLAVTFVVSEGRLTRVGKVSFAGIPHDISLDLRRALHALPGQPYSRPILNRDREEILTYFANRGYAEASVEASTKSLGAHEVEIDYTIQPGRREIVSRVIILGNHHTRAAVIRRAVTLRSGEPLSQTQVYDSQRKLYELGLFNGVEITPADPGGRGLNKVVLVRVQEANRWTLGYGFGLDVQRLGGNQPSGELRASPRLSFDATRINVGGRAQTFSFRGRLSDLETGAETSYVFSNFLNHHSLSLHADLLADQTRDVLTFTSQLEQASLTLEKQFSPSTFLLGRYNYRFVSVSSLRIDPEEIPLVSQPVRDAGFESTFIRDTRNDPADATRGSYSLLDGSVSASDLGSGANFFRLFGQNSTYHRFATHLVFARSTQFGVESSYGPPRSVGVAGGTILTSQIPLAERFFAGGSDSIRAFSLNQAGPRDPVTGYPIGGDALFVNSIELRMPFRSGRYGVVLFNDSGNVYSQIQEMRLLKFVQTSSTDLNYTVDAAGVGFRYKTPIGPIRLDLAYGLNTPRYEITPVNQPSQILRLPRFQYFVSIGQSF